MKASNRISWLATQEDIFEFFLLRKDVVFVIDQLNALEREGNEPERTVTKKVEIHYWLTRLRSPGQHKAILSLSANNDSIHKRALRRSNGKIMYPGRSQVSPGRGFS